MKFITLVREPISRNVSAFFENYTRFTGRKFADHNACVDNLTALFLREYKHAVPLTWFDWEISPVLGIDVYDQPFPHERGWQIIKRNNLELLILKLETDDSRLETAIADFLGLNNFTLTRANQGTEKEYADTYEQFREQIQLPEAYVNIMYTSEYVKHFYSRDEIQSLQKKWQAHFGAMELPIHVRHHLSQASDRTLETSNV